MIIYLNNDYKCHVEDDGAMTPYETDAFEGKCRAYIEGTRIVPEGKTWIREDGVEFPGLMISPCIDSRMREAAQQGYEESLAAMADMQLALEVMEVEAE